MTDLEAISIDYFAKANQYFWIDRIEGILERFSDLEYPNRFNFYCLLFWISGEGEIVLDDQKVRLDLGKAVFCRPGTIVELKVNRTAEGFIVVFTENFFSLRYNDNVLQQFSFLKDYSSYVRLNTTQTARWQTLFAWMMQEVLQDVINNKVLRSYLNILLFDLEAWYRPHSRHVLTNDLKSSRLRQFENLVEQHYVRFKLPSDYAEMLNISPNYLNRICKEELGCTAGDMIRKRVALEAQRLLHHTALSVNEIADKLGFDNAAYFTTFFKKQIGFSPEKYRKEA